MDNQPPQSLDAERAVLGMILKDPDAFDRAYTLIKDHKAFYSPKNQAVYHAAMKLAVEGEPIDIVTVARKLDEEGMLVQVGGRLFLAEICEDVVSSNVEAHAQIVKDMAIRRRLIRTAQGAVEAAYEASTPVSELLNKYQEGALSVTDESPQVEILSKLIEGHVNRTLSGKDNSADRYLTTRVAELDRIIMGFFKGQMSIVAAPPSMGKTSFAVDFSYLNARKGKRVLYVALDEDKDSLTRRYIANLTALPRNVLVSGRMDDQQKRLYNQATATLAQVDTLHIMDTSGATVMDIMTEARKIRRRHGLDCVIVDYVQQLRDPKSRKDGRTVEVQEISSQLKVMCKELDVAVVALSQFSRKWEDIGDGEFPGMSMLKESSGLEQDANLIVFPWNRLEFMRKRYGEESEQFRSVYTEGAHPTAHLIVSKQKEGPTGSAKCRWDPERMRYYSAFEGDPSGVPY